MSLRDMYNGLLSFEQEKIAAEKVAEQEAEVPAELVKMAQEYDEIGRGLARQVWNDMAKEAMPVGHGPGSKHEDGEACPPSCSMHKKDDDEDDKGDEEEGGKEKKASLKAAILNKMASDPKYLSYIINKYTSR
jgi:hypothetical protein